MEGEYGQLIGNGLNWVSSFWGTAAPTLGETELAQLAGGQIGTMPTPQDPMMYEEELSFEDSIIEQSRMEGELRYTRGTVNQAIEMEDLNPLQRQQVALNDVENQVTEMLEAPPEDADPGLSRFIDEQLGIEDVPELGSAAYEETLVRREVQLAEDGFETVARMSAGAEDLLESGGALADIAEITAEVGTWTAIGLELVGSLATMGVLLGVTEFVKWIIRDIDERHKTALTLAGFATLNYGHFTGGPSEDYPGWGTAAFAILGGQYGITINCKIIGFYDDDPDYWFVEYRDLYSYLHREVKIHKTRCPLEWGNTKVRDLTKEQLKRFRPTSNYKRDKKGSTWATSKYLGRYPLYPVGTPVKSVKSGKVGKIVQTYDHNGTDKPDHTGVWNTKDGDKYGIQLDMLPGHEYFHKAGHQPTIYHRIDELLVENPMNAQWDRVADKIKQLGDHGSKWIDPSVAAVDTATNELIDKLVKTAERLSRKLGENKLFPRILVGQFGKDLIEGPQLETGLQNMGDAIETDDQYIDRLQTAISEMRATIKQNEDAAAAVASFGGTGWGGGGGGTQPEVIQQSMGVSHREPPTPEWTYNNPQGDDIWGVYIAPDGTLFREGQYGATSDAGADMYDYQKYIEAAARRLADLPEMGPVKIEELGRHSKSVLKPGQRVILLATHLATVVRHLGGYMYEIKPDDISVVTVPLPPGNNTMYTERQHLQVVGKVRVEDLKVDWDPTPKHSVKGLKNWYDELARPKSNWEDHKNPTPEYVTSVWPFQQVSVTTPEVDTPESDPIAAGMWNQLSRRRLPTDFDTYAQEKVKVPKVKVESEDESDVSGSESVDTLKSDYVPSSTSSSGSLLLLGTVIVAIYLFNA